MEEVQPTFAGALEYILWLYEGQEVGDRVFLLAALTEYAERRRDPSTSPCPLTFIQEWVKRYPFLNYRPSSRADCPL